VAKDTPDVILLNEWFHGMDILSAVEELRTVTPRAKLVVMGALAEGMLIRDLFACGVNGYLYKSDDLQDCLLTALDTVMRDRPYLSPTANAEYLVALHSLQPEGYLDDEAREVLNKLAKGIHAGQIARAGHYAAARLLGAAEAAPALRREDQRASHPPRRCRGLYVLAGVKSCTLRLKPPIPPTEPPTAPATPPSLR
jgi:hypothetical protein